MPNPIARRAFAAGLAAAALAGTALAASNQALFFKFEMTASYAWDSPRLNSAYLHSYSPPFTPGSYRSEARQTLVFEGRKAHGYAAGFRYFPVSKLGVEVLYDAFKADLAGVNSNYRTALTYVVRVPPLNVPVEQSYAHEEPWPDTTGEIKETIISVNAAARAPIGSRLSVKVSGGPSFCTLEARSTYIGFTKYWLTGPTVLFKQEYKLGLDWGKLKAAGFNLGGEIVLNLFSNMGLSFGARYFAFADSEIRWQVITGEGVSETPEELGRLMSLGPVKVDPSLVRAGLGLRFLF